MLDHITPVLLTFNEEENIGRTLSHLAWAKDIVIVDSGSTDGTLSVIQRVRNVRIFNHQFTTHASQWRFAVEETNISTEWILRLDADYQLTDALISELARLDPTAPLSAYRIKFDYSIFSHPMLSSLYPSNTVLVRRACFSIRNDGHTERWDVAGPVGTLRGRIIHDDWKPVATWLAAQARYMRREIDAVSTGRGGVAQWLRCRPPLMPIAVFLYCLFGKGLVFNGRAGVFYALQRLVAEAVLSLMILERKFRAEIDKSPHSQSGQSNPQR